MFWSKGVCGHMGGSGGGDSYSRPTGSGVGGTQPGQPAADCLSVRFSTVVQAVAGAPTHAPGTTLEVMRVSSGGNPTLLAIDDSGTSMGTIVEEVAALLRCISDGFAFVADVTSVTSGVHTVTVRASLVSNAVGDYSVAGPVTAGTYDLAVDAGDPATELSAGTNDFARHGVCELRSLLRVAVPFRGTIDESGAIAVVAS
ncbi:MAG: hypothetical protein ACT452_16835 [Microthrixaceae bacterium]